MIYKTKVIVKPANLAGKQNGLLPDKLLADIPGGRLHKNAVAGYKAMCAAALKAGVTLEPTSSADTYRLLSIQERAFFQRYSSKPTKSKVTRTYRGQTYWLKKGYAPSATPGTSNHGWGLAVDIANASGKRFQWLVKNANKYGWYMAVADSTNPNFESWHWQYVLGKPYVPRAKAKKKA